MSEEQKVELEIEFRDLEKLISDAQERLYKFVSILNIMDSMLERERESLKDLYSRFIKEENDEKN